MSKPISTNFTVLIPAPLDSRFTVTTFAGLALIPIPYDGLLTYVRDAKREYRYTVGSGWAIVPITSGGDGVWGSITGILSAQTDLQTALNLKFDKSGGTITGATTVLADVDAYNFVIFGSAPTTENPYVQTTVTGEPAGSSIVTNTVFISSADHVTATGAGTLVVGTYYIIT